MSEEAPEPTIIEIDAMLLRIEQWGEQELLKPSVVRKLTRLLLGFKDARSDLDELSLRVQEGEQIDGAAFEYSEMVRNRYGFNRNNGGEA